MVREAGLLVRTRDHSYLEQRQQLPPLASKSQELLNRNILFTCLGSPAKPVLDIAGPVPLLQGDTLMLCSDGLWGSLSDEDIVFELAHRPVDEAVPELVEKALRKAGDTSDNVTAIALEWETPDSFASTRGSISTSTISDGVFASTIQAGWPDSGLEDLDDAAIERSIAEINEAIRRSAARRS
jgi:serine/threonine protein phosphatase PrpC